MAHAAGHIQLNKLNIFWLVKGPLAKETLAALCRGLYILCFLQEILSLEFYFGTRL